MKKIILLVILTILLSSCFSGDNKEIEEAKENMGIKTENSEEKTSSDNTIKTNDSKDTIIEENKEDDKEKIDSNFKIEYLDDNKLIELNDLSGKNFDLGEVEITGKTLIDNVDKITVDFSNHSSDFPNDNYTLQKFESGDNIFKYNASSRNQVLDFGKNEYIFTAFSDEKISKIKLSIFVDDKEETVYEKKTIGTEDNSVYLDFPKNDSIGEVIPTGEDSFTYSKIDNLDVKKENFDEISCDEITDFLSNRINSWYYWNTCRDIVKDKGISFYVISLEGDTYTYEKHYIDFIHSLYGVYKIEDGSGVDKNTIADKNNELKEKNEDIKNINEVDNLFKEIVGG